MNPNITWDIVRDNRDNPWEFVGLSLNPNIKWEHVLESAGKPWNFWHYGYLSANPNITWDTIIANPTIHWCYRELSKNTSIRMEHVMANLNEDWDWDSLSSNTGVVDFEKLKKYFPGFPGQWNWSLLSANPKILWNDIIQNTHMHWDFYFVMLNPNITWNQIMSCPDKDWEFGYLAISRVRYKTLISPEYREKVRAALTANNMRLYHHWKLRLSLCYPLEIPSLMTNIPDVIEDYGPNVEPTVESQISLMVRNPYLTVSKMKQIIDNPLNEKYKPEILRQISKA